MVYLVSSPASSSKKISVPAGNTPSAAANSVLSPKFNRSRIRVFLGFMRKHSPFLYKLASPLHAE